VNWKIPGWAAGAGAAISLAAGLAGGNHFGTILLRAVVSALLAGALGFAARYVLRRFLPGIEAPPAPSPGVDILIDEEVPLAAGEAGQGSDAPGKRPSDSSGVAPGFTPGSALGLVPEEGQDLGDSLEQGLGEIAPTEAEPFPAPGGRPGSTPDFAPSFTAEEDVLAALEEAGESLEPAEGPEELPAGETLEALSGAGDSDDGLSGFSGVAAPSRRALKAEELEAQLDNVTKGQDPVSLAKAVRTFLRKDQEG
jgi:hypothetical protein